MRTSALLLAALSVVNAAPAPQGVTEIITPNERAPENAKTTLDHTFGLSISPAEHPDGAAAPGLPSMIPLKHFQVLIRNKKPTR
jgi:hypothetical protein